MSSSIPNPKPSQFLLDIDIQAAKRFSKEAFRSLGGAVTQGAIPLKVPFREKEDAKKLGALYNGRQKIWYVPGGVDPSPFKRWF
ncbi:DUF5710 domain-containing protein [Undibacterium sp. Di24W]|uniref:DUF5710 domain-containing protein n=1 Tax=Undibacterium sp. Di24W TaxID=3413033 RepID=UPI003BEFC3E2